MQEKRRNKKKNEPSVNTAEDLFEPMQNKLKVHSAENMTKALHKIEAPTFLSSFAPIVDGQLIPNRPRVSFSAQFGSLFREIDLLVGLSVNPAHYILSNEDLKSGISLERREKIFRWTLISFFLKFNWNILELWFEICLTIIDQRFWQRSFTNTQIGIIQRSVQSVFMRKIWLFCLFFVESPEVG